MPEVKDTPLPSLPQSVLPLSVRPAHQRDRANWDLDLLPPRRSPRKQTEQTVDDARPQSALVNNFMKKTTARIPRSSLMYRANYDAYRRPRPGPSLNIGPAVLKPTPRLHVHFSAHIQVHVHICVQFLALAVHSAAGMVLMPFARLRQYFASADDPLTAIISLEATVPIMVRICRAQDGQLEVFHTNATIHDIEGSGGLEVCLLKEIGIEEGAALAYLAYFSDGRRLRTDIVLNLAEVHDQCSTSIA